MTVFVVEIADILTYELWSDSYKPFFCFIPSQKYKQTRPKHCRCDVVLKWSYCTLYTFYKFSSHFLVGTWDMFFFSLAYRQFFCRRWEKASNLTLVIFWGHVKKLYE